MVAEKKVFFKCITLFYKRVIQFLNVKMINEKTK